MRDIRNDLRSDIMYNYLNVEQETQIITMLCDDSYSIEDILMYIDDEMGKLYKLGYEDGELHA